MPQPINIVFEKVGRAKYISHLDMDRCLTRAFKRCHLPVWYTEGFNKRMYLSLTVPLSLGFESVYEVLELKLEQELPFDEVLNRLNAVMPEGIHMLRAAVPTHKPGQITSVSYEVTLHDAQPDKLFQAFTAFLEQESILVEKKSKKGVVSEVDLKPLMKLSDFKLLDNGISYAGSYAYGQAGNMNPMQLITAFAGSLGKTATDFAPRVLRTGIYAGDELFVG